jgi:hypothetical protein
MSSPACSRCSTGCMCWGSSRDRNARGLADPQCRADGHSARCRDERADLSDAGVRICGT